MKKLFKILLMAMCILPSQAIAAPQDAMLTAINQPRYTRHSEERNVLCLALNLYHEARGSTERDIRGVAWVTRNRVESPFSRGRNYCGIIWERGQYSWTVRSVNNLLPREIETWHRMVRISQDVIDGNVTDPTNGANTFYRSSLGTPAWTRRGTGRIAIGSHTYVKLPGR